MFEFGTTREQLAAVAVAARDWALLNPKAWEKKPLTVDQVLSARMVSNPLTVRAVASDTGRPSTRGRFARSTVPSGATTRLTR